MPTSTTRNRILLYADILVLGIAALALVAAVHNAYYTGFWQSRVPLFAEARAFWTTVDLVVLAGAMAWFLGRFYRARIREIARMGA